MANTFSSEISSLESYSRGDHQEITASKNHSYSTQLSDIEDEDAGDLENAFTNKVNLEERLKRKKGITGELRKQLEEAIPYESQKENCVIEEADLPKQTVLPEDIQSNLPNYEESLNHSQANVLKTLEDRRASLRRQISINNYKRRLLEVENMCHLELLRVKQGVQFLQPMQMMESKWKSSGPNFSLLENFNPETQESSAKDYFNGTKKGDTLLVEPSGNPICNDSNSLVTEPYLCGRQSPQTNCSSTISQDGDGNVPM